MPEREETVGDKRIVREYDDHGRLLRLRILPLPTPEAPPKRRLAFGRGKKAAPPAPAVGTTLPTAEEPQTPRETPAPAPPVPAPVPTAPEPALPEHPAPPAPPPALVAAAAPVAPPVAAPPVVHVRFRGESAAPGIDVVVEPFADAGAPVLSLVPPPVVFVEPERVEPAPVVFREPEPVVAPPVAVPRFEIVALEPVVVEPSAEAVPVVASEPAPESAAEPVPARAPEPEVAPEPAAEPVAPAPPPEEAPVRPASYVALVPDVDGRVDALLARGDAPAKRRKRAPIPAPVFEPLQREPWEDRLDAALASR